MPTIQLTGISDILFSTLSELGEGKWTDMTTDLQRFVVLPNITKKNRVTIGSGKTVTFDVITDENNSARFVGLFASDRSDVPNVLAQGEVPFRNLTASYSIDARELTANEGKRQIVSLIKSRRHACMMSIAHIMERTFWRVPATSDDLTPYGVPYWVVKSATAGFTGTVPSGYSSVAGLSTTTYPRWRNYAAPYSLVTKEDLIARWWKAARLTDFEPPVVTPTFNTGDDYGYYTVGDVYDGLKTILESQNENLGSDLDSQNGRPTFQETKVVWVPELDQDTTNPLYGLNWGEFKTAIHGNWWMKETVIDKVPGQHTVSSVYVDATFNYLCRNRRRNFVISNGVTLPA